MKKNLCVCIVTAVFMLTVHAQPKYTTWQAQLNIKDNGGSANTLTFGQATEATNGLDASLGEQELPPLPPSGIFDIRFELPQTPPPPSMTDFRNSSLTSAVWTIYMQPGAGGYPFTLTWNSSQLPQSASFFLKDQFGGVVTNVNMKTSFTYTLANTGINRLIISASGLSETAAGIQPASVYLIKNYPNPFNPATRIRYSIGGGEYIKLQVFDSFGRLVTTLREGFTESGEYEAVFDGAGNPAGVYYARLSFGKKNIICPMLLLK